MAGFAHIFRLGEATGTHGRTAFQYQFNYTIGGNTYVRVFEEGGLREFLGSEIGMMPEAIDKAIRELWELGKTTIAAVEIPAHEVGALGLEQLPSDY